MNNIRPTPAKIRKAFGEYTTECFSGYEQTAWDLMKIGGLNFMFETLDGVFPNAGIYEPFEDYSEAAVEDLIINHARRL